MKQPVLLFLRGLLMGIADVIPGISGGTIALITGIYPQLVQAISNINSSSLFKGQVRKFSASIDLKFFFPLVSGIGLAIYFFSGIIGKLLHNYPGHLYSFFIGLIFASVYFLYKKNKQFEFGDFILMLVGFIFAYGLSKLSLSLNSHSLPVVFTSAVIAICAMILPGISGAYMLVLLNQYEYLISALHKPDVLVILTVVVGAITGLLLFCKLLRYLLKKWYTPTIYFLIGLMAGSLRVPINNISLTETNFFFIALWIIAGFLLVLLLEKQFWKK